MKKKMILPIVIAFGMASAPIRASEPVAAKPKVKIKVFGAIQKLLPLINQVAEITKELLKGTTIKNAEAFIKITKELTAELNKPIRRIDFPRVIVLAKKTNDLGLILIKDLESTMKVVLKPVKTILPRKKITIAGKEFYLDDVPGNLVKNILSFSRAYQKLANQLLVLLVKEKETVKPAAAPEIIEVEEEIPAPPPIEEMMMK